MRIIHAVLAAVVVLDLLGGPLAAPAQPPPGKTARIGFLGDVPAFLNDAFRQGLRELGYVDSQNIAIEYRAAEWKYERLPALAAELVRLKVDVIVAASPPATEAAKRATSTIPIVFTVSGDPVVEGFVAGLARPGGNLTGLATTSPELVGKQLEMLKEVASKVSLVAVLQNPNQPSHRIAVGWSSGRDGRAACARGVAAVRCRFLEGKRAWEGRPEWRGSDREVLCHVAVSHHGTLWGGSPGGSPSPSRSRRSRSVCPPG